MTLRAAALAVLAACASSAVYAASVSVAVRGPGSYATVGAVANVSFSFSAPVTGFLPSMVSAYYACATSNTWVRVRNRRGGVRYTGLFSFGSSRCPKLDGGSAPDPTVPAAHARRLQVDGQNAVIYVRSDVVPEGNEASNTLVVSSSAPTNVANLTIEAPKFWSPSDSTVSVRLQFTQNVGYISPTSVVVTGAAAPTSWRYTNCIFFREGGADKAGATGTAEREQQAQQPRGRALQGPGFGSCTYFLMNLVPTPGSTASITVSVPATISSTRPVRAAAVTIPYDAVSPRAKYNVTISTRNGRNTFGDRDKQVYVYFTFTGDPGAVVTGFDPSDVITIPSGAAVVSSKWLVQPSPRVAAGAYGEDGAVATEAAGAAEAGSPSSPRRLQIVPPGPGSVNQYEIAITPLRNRWFGVLVGENVVNVPGNNRAFQNFTYTGQNGGDDRPPTVRVTGAYSFNSTTRPIPISFEWTGQTNDVATFAAANVRTAGCSLVASSFQQADSYTFTASVLPNMVGGVVAKRIYVWVPAGVVRDNFASYNFSSSYRSSIPAIRPTIEAPSFFSYGRIVPIYVVLDTPVSVSAFLPTDLRLTGATLARTSWVGISSSRPPTGLISDFEALLAPTSDGNGGYNRISVSVPGNVIRVEQGNSYSNYASLTYAQATGVRPPQCSLLSAAPDHSGPGDEFLVEVNCTAPISGAITSSYGSFVIVNGQSRGYLSGTTFPAMQFYLRVRPSANADVTVVLPRNRADPPGNSRGTVTVRYDPASPGSPTLTQITSAYSYHAGDETFPTIRVTVSFSKPILQLVGLNVTRVVGVINGYIQGGAWSSPPSNFSGYASLVVVPVHGKDVIVSVGANVVPGANNAPGSLIIPYKAPGVTATITTESPNHDGRCPIAYDVTFSGAVTGFSASGVSVSGYGTPSVVPTMTGSGAGPYKGHVIPGSSAGSLRVQVGQDVVASPASGNYESASYSVSYRRPSWRSALTPTVTGPGSHDGYSPFAVTFTWPSQVYNFQPASLQVTGGTADAAWQPLAPTVDCLSYTVNIRPEVQTSIAVALPTGSIPSPGNAAAEVSIPFQAQPTPSPAPTPSAQPTPPPIGNRCAGGRFGLRCNNGQCVGTDGGYCQCNQGYTGYDCSIQVPTASASCFNMVKDAGESDVDCGGPCGPCPMGFKCAAAGDCSGADAICTTAAVCTGRLIDAALATGGQVVSGRMQFLGLAKGAFTSRVELEVREAIASYVGVGSTSGKTYNPADILITRVDTAAASVARGDAAPERLERIRQRAAASGRGLQATQSTVISYQVNLFEPADGPGVVNQVNYATGGHRLLNRLTSALPGIHIASVDPVAEAAVTPAQDVSLTPISGTPTPTPGGVSPGVTAAVAVACLVVGGIIGAGIIFATGGCQRRTPLPKHFPTSGAAGGAASPASGRGLAGAGAPVDDDDLTGPSSKAVVNPLDGVAINTDEL